VDLIEPSQETHLQVALKAVKRDKLSAKLFDNLQSEIQILKSLSHRHVTRLLDIVVRALDWGPGTRQGTGVD
jgi:serine/threonine protein kinase